MELIYKATGAVVQAAPEAVAVLLEHGFVENKPKKAAAAQETQKKTTKGK